MHLSIHHLIHQYGYWGVFVLLTLEMIGIPVPAETTLTFLGVEWNKGNLPLAPYLIAAALGNIAGSTIAYGIGLGLGRTVILRYGKWVKITPERLDRAEQTFGKYGYRLIAGAKFIAGVRVLVPYLAGINRIPFLRFTLVNSLSALVWAFLFMALGKYMGIVWVRYMRHVHHAWIPIVLVGAGIVFVLILKRKRKSSAVHE